MRTQKAQFVVSAGVFIAMIVIFTHVFAIQATYIRISFGFLPVALFAAKFGPVRGGLVAAVADLIGCMAFSPGLFFPGFTLSAFCSGFIFGSIFYGRNISLGRIIAAFLLVGVIVDLGMNTLWLMLMYQKAAGVFWLGRLSKSVVLIPMQVILLYLIYKPLYYYHWLQPVGAKAVNNELREN